LADQRLHSNGRTPELPKHSLLLLPLGRDHPSSVATTRARRMRATSASSDWSLMMQVLAPPTWPSPRKRKYPCVSDWRLARWKSSWPGTVADPGLRPGECSVPLG
jgi:hypothetical protein